MNAIRKAVRSLLGRGLRGAASPGAAGAEAQSPRLVAALVGHCGFDEQALAGLVRRVAPDAQIRSVRNRRALEEAVEAGALLLVNRALVGRFAARDGVELIGSLRRERGDAVLALLVSDYAEAQQRAEQAGALPGFGKAQLHSPEAQRRLAEAVAKALQTTPSRTAAQPTQAPRMCAPQST